MPALPRTSTRRKSNSAYLSTVNIPPGYRNAIRKTGMSDAQTTQLLDDAHATCTIHDLPIVTVVRGVAGCEACIAAVGDEK